MFFILFMLAGIAQALPLDTHSFHFCSRKTAKGVLVRTLRIHKIEKQCVTFYSVKGQDQQIAQARWLSFCENKAQQLIKNLQEGGWNCKKENSVTVFYPFISSFF